MRDFFIVFLRLIANEIRGLAIVATALVLSAAPLLATTRTVNNLNDFGPGSLRQLISDSAANDTINFSVTGTITLTSGELLINKNLTINGPGANLLIVQRSTAGGTPVFSIFDIPIGHFNVTISGLWVANGSGNNGGGGIFNQNSGTLTVVGCTISGNTASFTGGGISNAQQGTVNLTSSMIYGNTANSGGGISNFSQQGTVNLTDCTISGNTASSGDGGGISNDFQQGTVNLTDCTISGNTASSNNGGGISNGAGCTVNLTDCTISGNTASSNNGGGISTSGAVTIIDSTIARNTAGYGGGIFKDSGTVTITKSNISANSAASGGGIYDQSNGGVSGTVTVTDSTISDNAGGGISNSSDIDTVTVANSTISGNRAEGGGGISNGGGTVNVTNSTISDNAARGGFQYNFGGGISNGNGGTVNLTSSTISGNTASIVNGGSGGGIANSGAVNVRDTIIARNTAASAPDAYGTLTSYGFNLIGNNSGATVTPTTGDQIGTPGAPINPLLGPLTDNGGPTKTQALLPGSPAINAAGPSAPPRDQRHYLRSGVPDIGAFEFGGTIAVTLANISTRAFVQTGNNVMIGGFIITGGEQKKVIVRAIGPSLAQHGIVNPLQNPTLELHDHTGAVIASNDNWMNAPNRQEIIDSGLAPSNNLESAILTSLNPGSYTAIVRGANNGTGIALVEGYDLDRTAGSKFGNISTRALVQTGNNVMIGGLIITGPDSDKVIVRALGPSLAQHGITNPLLDPTLELHDGNGAVIAFNDNWKDTQEAEIEATGLAPSDDRESAIVRTLTPGNYTAIVRGKNNTSGVALMEAYGLN